MKMKKFVIKDDFWQLFPNAKIGIVVCRNVDNHYKENEAAYQDLLTKSCAEAEKYFTEEEFSSNPVIKIWREAFTKFKTKKGARSSIEALLKRVYKGNPVGTINPLVDIYNAISLKYALPVGGEDIDKFVGDIVLTKADGNENFVVLGSEENEPPYPGEIVYKDDEGAICRCFNWRESVRTMLTENTSKAFMCIELLDAERENIQIDALNELSSLIRENTGAQTEIHILSFDHREEVIEVEE